MDTISRENNSMLPVGGIVVGVIGLLLGGIALLQISKVNKTLAEHQVKVDQIEAVSGKADAAAGTADRVAKDLGGLKASMQDAVNTIAGEIGKLNGSVGEIKEALAKKPVAPAADSKKGGAKTPAVAGPGEYIVKAGDASGTKIAKNLGVSLADLQAVNPSTNWSKLKIGDKLKVPAKK